MATISITVSDAFVAAVQQEAAIDGIGAQAWAKKVIKATILDRRMERASKVAEATKVTAIQDAAATATDTYDATLAAERAAIEALN